LTIWLRRPGNKRVNQG